MPNDKIECSFSLLDSGRKYSGQHRKYLIENAREICYSPTVRERIKMREALGYYGHGRRVLCGRMDIQEVDVVTLPDGSQAMVSNVPSNVTVQFDISKDGLVSPTQEILNTATGKIVAALHASRGGGYSWACPGEAGRSARATGNGATFNSKHRRNHFRRSFFKENHAFSSNSSRFPHLPLH